MDINLKADNIFTKGMEMGISIKNLFDDTDYRGGTPLIPYPQEGRNILFTVGYRF